MYKVFYQRPIFWAGLAILTGFFVPWLPWAEIGDESISGLEFVKYMTREHWINYVFYLLPGAALMLVIGPIVGLRDYTGIARWVIIFLIIFFLLRLFFDQFSYGLWMTMLAAILLYYDSRIFGEEEY